MMRRCVFGSGVVLIAVALAAVPSGMIVESYVGGSAVHGHVEGGRYFVNPGHGRPVVEVSEPTWRAVYRVERLWPFSILAPGFAGMFLTACARRPGWKPLPAPPKELPPWMLWSCLASAGAVVAGAWLCWVITRTPWVVMLVGWVLICAGTGTIVGLYTRALRRRADAGAGAAPDRGGK